MKKLLPEKWKQGDYLLRKPLKCPILSGGFCFIHAVFWWRGERDHNRRAWEGSLVLYFSKTEKTHSTYIFLSQMCFVIYFFVIDWFLSFFAFLSNISGQLRRAFSVHSCNTFLLSLSIVFFFGCFLFYNHWFVFCVLCTMLGIVAGLLPDISVCTTHRGQRTEIIKLHIFTQN